MDTGTAVVCLEIEEASNRPGATPSLSYGLSGVRDTRKHIRIFGRLCSRSFSSWDALVDRLIEMVGCIPWRLWYKLEPSNRIYRSRFDSTALSKTLVWMCRRTRGLCDPEPLTDNDPLRDNKCKTHCKKLMVAKSSFDQCRYFSPVQKSQLFHMFFCDQP